MPEHNTPVQRPIGWTGALRWIVAVAATIAVGAAFYKGRYALGAAGTGFLIVAVVLAVRAARSRRDAGGNF